MGLVVFISYITNFTNNISEKVLNDTIISTSIIVGIENEQIVINILKNPKLFRILLIFGPFNKIFAEPSHYL